MWTALAEACPWITAALVVAAAAAPAAASPTHGKEEGVLDVRSNPPARIVIDDKDTGSITPTQLSLPAGHHNLLLVTPDGARERTMGFTLEPGQVLTLSLRVDRKR